MRFIKRNLCFLGLLVIWAAGHAQSEGDTIQTHHLQDVIVTERVRTSAARQSAPLQIINRVGIERMGMQELAEAVRYFSGITVKDYGGIGGLKTVSIRSLGAQHTTVGYDGVSISDAQSGQVDISRFTLDNVEMVSLSTGLSDDIFQTARMVASAGTLHIKTLKPRFDDDTSWQMTAKLKGGSFGLLNPVLSYSRRLNSRWSASAYADYMRADSNYPFTLVNGTLRTRETRLNSDIETVRIEGNLYGEFGLKGGEFEAKQYTFHSERGLPGSVNFYNRTATERLWNDNRFFQTRYKNRLSDMFAIQTVAKYTYAYSRYRDENDKYAAGFQEDRNTQHEYYGSAGILFTPLTNVSASLTTDYIHTLLRNNFLHAAQPRRNTSLTAFSLQYQSNTLTATGTLLGAYTSDKVENGDRPDANKHSSPAIAFSWRPFRSNAFRIRSSYKDVYRIPTFTDLYYLRAGNTNLKPEKAKQWNAGLTWSGAAGSLFRYASISADGYYNKIEDKIVALPTLYIWKMMNMGKVEIKGADINISAEMPLYDKVNTSLACNYTFQYAIDLTNPDAKNYKHQIPYTPRHTGNGVFSVETPWINISYLLTAVGERYALPQNTKTNRIDAYIEQSISLNRTFQFKKFTLRVQGELLNLADAQYDVIQYYPMPGRSMRLSVQFKIQKNVMSSVVETSAIDYKQIPPLPFGFAQGRLSE